MPSIWLHYLGDERYDYAKPGPIPGLREHLPGDKIEFTPDLLAEFNRTDARQFAVMLAGYYNGGGVPQRYEVLEGDDPETATVIDDDVPAAGEQAATTGEQLTTTGEQPAATEQSHTRGHRTAQTTDAAPQAPQGE